MFWLQINVRMGLKGRETTVEERESIISLHNQCKSLNENSEVIGRPRATIQLIIDRVGYPQIRTP